MKKYALMAIFLLFCTMLAGCPARRPENPESQQQPQTIVVPEVSKISFDTVDLAKAPGLVRDVADQMPDEEAAAWLSVDNNMYILVARDEDDGMRAEVAQILQRVPRDNQTWLDVKIKQTKQGKNEDGDKPQVVRVNRSGRDINGVGFDFNGGEEEQNRSNNNAAATPAPKPAPAAGTAGQANKQAPVRERTTEITTPKANEAITSPVTITGKSASTEQLRVRLRTEGGKIMSESPVATNADSSFQTTMNFSPPDNPQRGMVELISGQNGAEDILARTPVNIK